MLAPESSAFGTKPRRRSARSGRRSRSRRGSRRARPREAAVRAEPRRDLEAVEAGSWTSRRTTSGRSSAASSSASGPLAASPTTTKPSASSTARAVARKLGWSSTTSTVLARAHGRKARRRAAIRLPVVLEDQGCEQFFFAQAEMFSPARLSFCWSMPWTAFISFRSCAGDGCWPELEL